jgi:hypothetical protein
MGVLEKVASMVFVFSFSSDLIPALLYLILDEERE